MIGTCQITQHCKGDVNMRAYGSNRIPFALLDYSSKKNSRHTLSKNFKRCMKKHERHCVRSQIHSGRDYIL